MAVEVSDAPGANRYEAYVDGESKPAGITQYIRTAELVAFEYTEVEPAHVGRGVGSALARAALDDAHTANLRVLVTYPFFTGWIARHPDYQDLLYQSRSRVSD
ncbi:GNAT family N-acetyltransferase [Streptomyces parvulus]|uniref:GNAT family N-acetyltransferase n=1 Tax=Streptomyces parvulus TaxID=146923 RepID=UPI0033177361